MSYIHLFFFGIYPYIALTIFLLGSLIRFDREQYSWKSESSELLDRGNLRIANILFHVGVLGLFFGHLVGLLTPIVVWDTIGVTHQQKQLMAMLLGGVFGSVALIGLLMLIYRRFTSARLLATSTWRDKLVLIWLLITLLLGLGSIFVSAHHTDGKQMVQLMNWAQHTLTFRGDAASLITDVSLIFKLHLVMAMTLFVIFPFTRLVHIWSGFGTLSYLARAWQLVRVRNQ